jgi:hypothetical protein
MSSIDKNLESVPVTGLILGEVLAAITTIVHIIKEQPAFDVALYDERVQGILQAKGDDMSTVFRAVLENTVSLDDETPKAL